MIIMLKILRSWKMNKVGLNEKEKFKKKIKLIVGYQLGRGWRQERLWTTQSTIVWF